MGVSKACFNDIANLSPFDPLDKGVLLSETPIPLAVSRLSVAKVSLEEGRLAPYAITTMNSAQENRPDIATHSDVERLVHHFYDKIRADDLVGPIFSDVAGVDWDVHLPVMVQFWESLLLGLGTYSGRPFPKHYGLPVEQVHFERWLTLFRTAVDDCFSGSKANEAKLRALAIADTFAMRMGVLKNPVALRDAMLPEGSPIWLRSASAPEEGR